VAILVLNCGSSSIKFSVIDPVHESVLLSGQAEGIGAASGRFQLQTPHRLPAVEERILTLSQHRQGLELILDSVESLKIDAVGHRVVHGGRDFRATRLVDEALLAALAQLDELAPLHNPANRLGIKMALELFPGIPQVAVFDTAFHATIPEYAHRYAIPDDWANRLGVRRYGFHGISHQYVCVQASRVLGRAADQVNVISLHLGNGASAAAVAGGRCVDTSMGMTPLEGLVMGTRCGDIDPGVLIYLMRIGWDAAQIDMTLNHESGLRGLCGENDMRSITKMAQEGDERAASAIELFCYRIRKYVGAYYAVLGRVDAVVFTAGIGEHDPIIREKALQGLDALGLRIDPTLNHADASGPRAIHDPNFRSAVLVIPTNEELQIASEVQAAVSAARAD